MNAYKLEAGTGQHAGRRPRQNDRATLFTASNAPGYVLAIVADGGATAAGADQLLHTARQLFDGFRPGGTTGIDRLATLLRDIAQETHDVLLMDPLARDHQTTMALLLLTPARQAVWATVGDSRVYRFADGAAAGRSDDAGYVDHLVTVDGVAPDSARRHRSSRLLNNVLGNRLKAPFVAVDSHENLQAGDGFLLCTDGLWSWFADSELAAVVARRTPREAAGLLIDKAQERAGEKAENCTMAIIRLVAPAAKATSFTVQALDQAV
ncbi:serine/threonine protein phosphatase PrpC [Pseudoduganella lurida]|uniref:Serine/threonine protein phosphatase PrpC n=1 Tax=Pseudoduganella lurida TaxID=1036180 RepID=A0A562RBV5_9BURK|nr:protein phosphatase 2C domain-containing protein [Pseudoduganella lurida]TWI66393.1 serine/threonine protein phosphatase PrpC [Pseudoduganella lurida]